MAESRRARFCPSVCGLRDRLVGILRTQKTLSSHTPLVHQDFRVEDGKNAEKHWETMVFTGDGGIHRRRPGTRLSQAGGPSWAPPATGGGPPEPCQHALPDHPLRPGNGMKITCRAPRLRQPPRRSDRSAWTALVTGQRVIAARTRTQRLGLMVAMEEARLYRTMAECQHTLWENRCVSGGAANFSEQKVAASLGGP